MMTERISWERPFPDSFAYGSLPFYLLKAVAETVSFLWANASTYDGLFYVGRGINAFVAVWLVWTTFRFARTLFDDTTPAYWAAFLVGTNTFVLQNSHFFTVDLLVTTLMTEALVQMTRIPREGRWRHYLLAAIFTGLALATKIGALSLMAPAALAFVFNRLMWRENPIPALCLVGGFIIALSGISLLGGLTLVFLSAPISWALPALLNKNQNELSLIRLRGWRYLVLCLPIILLLFYAGEPYAFDWKGTKNLLNCLSTTDCSVSSQIFSQQFLDNVGAEITMVRGITDPRPYTVQYLRTIPYLYHLNEMFWTTLGPLTAVFALFGLILEVRSRPTKTRAVPLLWAFLFFLTVAGSFVKFPRYLLPLYPLLFCYTGNAITWLIKRVITIARHLASASGSSFRILHTTRIGILLSAFLALLIGGPILIRALAFTAIYTVPHPYELASRWAFAHIPQGATILSMHWDDKLPLDLPGHSTRIFNMWSPAQEVAIYEPDSPDKEREISAQLAAADYIIFPSAKIPASVPRWTDRYPFSSRLLRQLFEGNIGFSLQKTVKNYPSFGSWYRINDDVSDESLTLYDHPKVYIFKKHQVIGADEIIQRVKQAPDHPVHETINFIQTISRDEKNPLPAFTPYTLGSILSWILLIELLAWIIRSPLKESVGLSAQAAAFASRPTGIFLFFGLFWWLNSVQIAAASSLSLWIVALACGCCRLIYRPRSTIPFSTNQTGALFFGISFLAILTVRSFQSEIFWGEKPMDFSFLNYFYRATSLPPTDPWATGNTMRYYYLGSYVMAQLGKMAGVAPAIAYNLAIATIGAAFMSSLAALFSGLANVSCRTAGWVATAITFLSNPESVLVCWVQKKVTFDTFWASTRLFRSPSFAEYPLWATIHADLHAHFIAAPLTILVALGVYLLKIRPAQGYQYLGARIFLGTTAGILLATNTWDMISLAIVGVCSGLLLSLSRVMREGFSCIPRLIFEGLLDILLVGLITSIISFPFLRDGLSGATSLGHGYVYENEFNNYTHLLRHFGIWLIIILVAAASRFLVDRKRDLWWQFSLLVVLVAPSIALFYDSAQLKGISGVPYSYLVVSLFLSLIAHQITCQAARDKRNGDKGWFVAGLLWAGSFIILFGELRFIGDRMNTIFKFYNPVWWMLGVAAFWLVVEWFRYRSEHRPISIPHRIVVSAIALSILVSPAFLLKEISLSIILFVVIFLSMVILIAFSSRQRRAKIQRGNSCSVLLRLPVSEYPLVSVVGLALSFGAIGSLFNAYSLTTINRAPQRIPSIDGTAYLARSGDPDWDLCRWLNIHVSGLETTIEASGDAYQDYTRIAMNTGLPTILGWEHHTNQRGTSRDDIERRKRALDLFYSTPSADTAALVARLYHARYVIVGTIERRLYRIGTYSLEGLAKFDQNPTVFEPVFRSGLSTVYRFLG